MDLLQSTIAAYGRDSSHVPAHCGPVFSAWPLSAPVSHATLSTQRYAIGLTCDLCYPQRGDVITCCVLHGNSRAMYTALRCSSVIFIHRFSGPRRAVGPPCVCVCECVRVCSYDNFRTK